MMICYDHRMIEGSPLHYYHPYIYASPSLTTSYSYFRRFDLEPKMTEELMMPNSPNSMQSDSDNSISSVDISPEPIQGKPLAISSKITETRCCWRSCGIVFESLDKLSDHVSKVHAISGLGGLYYCGWEGCARNNKGFNARYKMLVHVRTHTNEKPHQCNLCNKSFSRAENLKIHTRSHSGEKPYICPVPGCNKAYSNSSDRFKHTRTHQVEKPYQCKIPGCPKRYTDPSSLRKHVKTYKHFVNENNQVNRINSENLTNQREVPDIDKKEYEEIRPRVDKVNYETTKLSEPPYQSNQSPTCNCTHTCYLSKCLGINAFINIQEKEIRPWNNFIDPYFSDSKRMYADSYNLKETRMDVDL
ncbi:zinc finger protein, partial [Oryctes borbonicus]